MWRTDGGDDMEVGRLRSETQAWRVGEEGGSERGVWDDADQGLGWEPIYVTGRRQGRWRGPGLAGSKDPSRLVDIVSLRCPGVGLLMGS